VFGDVLATKGLYCKTRCCNN